MIQASLVDTWAATAAGAYTLTENSLYTVEAFDDYLDHLTDGGVLTITRWVADGLRLVSLAQEACARRGWDAAGRLAIVRQDRVATFLLKKTPFTSEEIARLRETADRLGFDVLYTPGAGPSIAGDGKPQFTRPAGDVIVDGAATGDYGRLITAPDRQQFYAAYRSDIRPTTDDRPSFFTRRRSGSVRRRVRAEDAVRQRSERVNDAAGDFGDARGAVRDPAAGISGSWSGRPDGWLAWLAYFGALGAGFMLIEVSVLQRFVLLLGHPVYSLTVTLFSLLLGTGLGAAWSRRLDSATLRRSGAIGIVIVAAIALVFIVVATPIVSWAIPFSRDGADAGRGGDADPDRHRVGHSDADRAAHPERARAADAAVGVGHERRTLRPRSDPGDLHCDELGLPSHPPDGLNHLPRRLVRPAPRDTRSLNQ